jgi:CsoR family transcriptional regulator, copper-sensing transcriptional repressor
MKRTGPHDPNAQAKILARLRSAEGHLRSVVAMVERDDYCIDVLRQTSAVRAAIAKVENLLLERHLAHCVSAAVRSDDEAERERVLGELVDLFEATKR